MEIIDFINDLRKMGETYFKVWFPIIVKFKNNETVIIKLKSPFDMSIPITTYYRVIRYGVSVFPKYVKTHQLIKTHAQLIISPAEAIQPLIIDVEPKEKEVISEVIPQETLIAKPILVSTKKPRKKSTEASYPNEVYEEIINFLNQATGKNYKTNSVINRKFITQRLNDGFTIDDFRQVISVKSANWLNSKMEQFLRPETLFSNKFESYLNENVVSNSPNSNLKNTYDEISKATEYLNSQG
jgi:uncharacterized phage protein (TIGR02220 family)